MESLWVTANDAPFLAFPVRFRSVGQGDKREERQPGPPHSYENSAPPRVLTPAGPSLLPADSGNDVGLPRAGYRAHVYFRPKAAASELESASAPLLTL